MSISPLAPAGAPLWKISIWVMAACWAVFFATGLRRYIWVHRERRRIGAVEEPSLRSRASLWGLLLEILAYGLIWGFRRPAPEGTAAVWIVCALVLAPLSCLFFAAALWELGRHFRIKAVVAADHELIMTGPYLVVRHPIYASMLGLLVSNAMVVARWEAAVCALILYAIGTEIRVRSEDGLLARRFPERFAAYRLRVPAYLPFLR
jgi:protein-S-isoprenylcysteine O-methyltransferase Ste14